jgi:hypothetical protein
MSSGSTSNYSLAYPVSTDPVNVAGDIKSLADDIDSFLTTPIFINNIEIDGGTISTDALSANLFNTNATTLNIGGAATTITLGAVTGATTIRNNLSLSTGKEYQINGISVISSDTLGSGVTESSLTSLGTVTTGTWSATEIAVDKGGTGITSYTAGDIVYASGASSISKLPIGSNNYVLVSDGSSPVWTQNTGTGNVVLADSPTLTGVPLAPTAAPETNTTQIATTEFVALAVSEGGSGTIVYQDDAPTVDLRNGTLWVDSNGEADLLNGNDFYTKVEIDTNIYTKTQVDTNIYTKAQVDELLSGAGFSPFLLMGA